MIRNFYESYARTEAKAPSERSTGLVFAAVAVIVGASWRHSAIVPWIALGIAVALVAVSLITPVVLKPVNLLWFKFGLLLHRIVNPLVMFAVFALAFVPAGALMRLWHDPLRAKRMTSASTYWIDRRDSTAGSMTNQF